MARALFENTRNPDKKVGSPACEPKRPMGRFCRISMCFQIHRLSGAAFGRAHALVLMDIFRWDKHFLEVDVQIPDHTDLHSGILTPCSA
jgi:hypothetical protein